MWRWRRRPIYGSASFRVGYVPVRHLNAETPASEQDGVGHIPGYVPDPLFDENAMALPSRETHAFWFTVTPSRTATAGKTTMRVTVIPATGREAVRSVTVNLHDVTIRKRRNFRFMQWFNCDSLLDFYGCMAFDERFWTLFEAYARNQADHHQDVIHVPALTPATDGVKRPVQLLKITKSGRHTYAFDWSDVKRYIDTAKAAGLRFFEWSHLFTQWGCKHAIHVYDGQGHDEKLLWKPDTPATSTTYRRFLEQFLPALRAFTDQEGILKNSYFHISDEPHGDEHLLLYRKARKLVREIAPWM